MADYRVHLHDPLSAALADLERAGERGARLGVRRGQQFIVRRARSNVHGRPRWDRRGRGKTGQAVNLHLDPPHQPRGGGPGVLTGDLRRGIHSVRPTRSANGYEGKVSALGGARNVYAGRVEKAYPFFEPAVREFDARAHALYEAAWAEEIGKVR